MERSGNGWTLRCLWPQLGGTCHLGTGISGGIFIICLEADTAVSWTTAHSLSMSSLRELLWAPSQHGGRVPGVSTLQSKADAHGIFMVLPQKLYSVTDFCRAPLIETITKVCPGSRGGIYGEDVYESKSSCKKSMWDGRRFGSHLWKMLPTMLRPTDRKPRKRGKYKSLGLRHL